MRFYRWGLVSGHCGASDLLHPVSALVLHIFRGLQSNVATVVLFDNVQGEVDSRGQATRGIDNVIALYEALAFHQFCLWKALLKLVVELMMGCGFLPVQQSRLAELESAGA